MEMEFVDSLEAYCLRSAWVSQLESKMQASGEGAFVWLHCSARRWVKPDGPGALARCWTKSTCMFCFTQHRRTGTGSVGIG